MAAKMGGKTVAVASFPSETTRLPHACSKLSFDYLESDSFLYAIHSTTIGYGRWPLAARLAILILSFYHHVTSPCLWKTHLIISSMINDQSINNQYRSGLHSGSLWLRVCGLLSLFESWSHLALLSWVQQRMTMVVIPYYRWPLTVNSRLRTVTCGMDAMIVKSQDVRVRVLSSSTVGWVSQWRQMWLYYNGWLLMIEDNFNCYYCHAMSCLQVSLSWVSSVCHAKIWQNPRNFPPII